MTHCVSMQVIGFSLKALFYRGWSHNYAKVDFKTISAVAPMKTSLCEKADDQPIGANSSQLHLSAAWCGEDSA